MAIIAESFVSLTSTYMQLILFFKFLVMLIVTQVRSFILSKSGLLEIVILMIKLGAFGCFKGATK